MRNSQKEVEALCILGFQFPKDLQKVATSMEQLPVDTTLKLRRAYLENFDVYAKLFNSIADRVVDTYCDICHKNEMSLDDIPKGWGWYDTGSRWFMMCNDCQYRYAEKFNKLPDVVREIPDYLDYEDSERIDDDKKPSVNSNLKKNT